MVMFRIAVTHERRVYRFNVKHVKTDSSFDYYEVIARNKTMTFKNNAPVLRRHSLKSRVPTWSIVSGDIWNATFKTLVVKEMNRVLGYI